MKEIKDFAIGFLVGIILLLIFASIIGSKIEQYCSRYQNVFNYSVMICSGESIENSTCFEVKTGMSKIQCEEIEGISTPVCSVIQLQKPVIFLKDVEIEKIEGSYYYFVGGLNG